MKIIALVMLAFLVYSTFFAACNGAVWFEGYNPQEFQEIRLNMQYIQQPPEHTPSSPPFCHLTLNETEPHTVNLTITVSTMALFRQTSNFETWLSIDSQEPEKLVGVLDSTVSATGATYQRQYNVTLNELVDGTHSIEIRVAGDYYGPDLEGEKYNCEGNITAIINDLTITPSPSVPEFSWLTILPLLLAIPIALVIFRKTVSRNITL